MKIKKLTGTFHLKEVLTFYVLFTLLFLLALSCFDGIKNLFKYNGHCVHKSVSLGLLKGQLHYFRSLTQGVERDMQVYNGAQFTHWGYGVPLLQLPFHFVYRLITGRYFFPDRFIFFVFLGISFFVSLNAFKGLFQARYGFSNISSLWLAGAVEIFLSVFGLFWLFKSAFSVNVETIGYFILFQKIILSLYILYSVFQKKSYLIWAGFLLGFTLLLRSTSLVYIAAWMFLFWAVKRNRDILWSFVAALPWVFIWMSTNYYKSGTLFSHGFQNSSPQIYDHFLMLRFGSPCRNSLSNFWLIAGQIFEYVFLNMPDPLSSLKDCGFNLDFKKSSAENRIGMPFLCAIVATLLYHLCCGRRRIETLVPYVGLVLLFISYVYAAAGFAVRYLGDFWPFITVILVHPLILYRDDLNALRRKVKFLSYKKLFFGLGMIFLTLISLIRVATVNWRGSNNLFLDENVEDLCRDSLGLGKDQYSVPPSRVTCPRELSIDTTKKNKNAYLWEGQKCEVGMFSNYFLNLPESSNDIFELVIETNRFIGKTLNTYINGRYYQSLWSGSDYRVKFEVNPPQLWSRVIVVSVLWGLPWTYGNAKLISVEIV